MFEVVCIRPCGEFDHLQGFATEQECRDYVKATDDGVCEFRIYAPNGKMI
jgi:hypothetical protein